MVDTYAVAGGPLAVEGIVRDTKILPFPEPLIYKEIKKSGSKSPSIRFFRYQFSESIEKGVPPTTSVFGS